MSPSIPSPRSYDAVVIGSGQGGSPLSMALAKSGLATALIEKLHVGGTCINVGCTPTKTMVASARAADLVRRSGEYGVHTGPPRVDLSEVKRRKQGVVESFRNGGRKRLEATAGLDLVFGEARLLGDRSVEVRLEGGRAVRFGAERIFLNVGCRPAPLDLKGLDRVPHLDSTSIMELDETPDHLLVLGGGYVGLEFSQMFRRFGSRVTIVQRGKQLLANEDPDVAEEVAKILREDGIEILLETKAVECGRGTDGATWLDVSTPKGGRRLEGSHLLSAAGRVPNTEDLGLEAAGVRTNARGFIEVNERLETSAPGIWAMGDVTGGPMFTHISYDDFRILRANLLEGGNATTKGRLVPYTVFIDPQLGRIGLSEAAARAAGRNVRVAKMPMSHVARAIEVGETRGFLKAVVDAGTGEILGFAALGIEGGELMSLVEVAMMGRVPWTVLKEAIFAHPTLAESLNNLFATLDS